jgi:hypothetical protein
MLLAAGWWKRLGAQDANGGGLDEEPARELCRGVRRFFVVVDRTQTILLDTDCASLRHTPSCAVAYRAASAWLGLNEIQNRLLDWRS